MSIAPAQAPVTTARRSVTLFASLAAVALLLAGGIIALIAPEQMDDHSAGLGRLSEALAGLALLAGAMALAPLTPRGIVVRILWLLGVIGLAGVGLTMLSVVVTTVEAPEAVVLAVVGLAALGLIAAGIIGIMRRIWPWWVGVAVALLVPIMFLLPYNSFFMAAVWALVAWRAQSEIAGTGD
jgi:hypothetical protein